MRKKLFSLLAILMMALTAQAATITVTWNKSDINMSGIIHTSSGDSFTKDGVTVNCDAIDAFGDDVSIRNLSSSTGTFTTTLGNFTKIEVTAMHNVSGTGWSGSGMNATWTGEASSSVPFKGSIMGDMGLTIVFTIEEEVAVTGVTLLPTTASLTAGGAALELTPTVAPEGATDKTVKWSVTQTGDFVALYTDEACTQAVGTAAIAAAKVYVKPLAAGQATITVTTNDGAKTATCAVTVAEPTYNVTFKAGTEDVSNWTATPSSAKKGETVTVKYTGTKKVKSVKAIKK